MTLIELYEQAKQQPRQQLPATPAAAFINEVMAVTKKSEAAVRRWLGKGENSATPDALTQEVLARHFDTTPEELFPQSNN